MNTGTMIINFLFAAVITGTPILFGTLGEIVNQKAGHINLGIQGIMAVGGCAGFMAGYFTDNLALAILCAMGAGALTALIYAVLTVTFMANQNVTGLTLTIFGVGLANFIGKAMLKSVKEASGNTITSLKLGKGITASMSSIHIPFLSDIPVVGKLLFSYNIFVYISLVIAVVLTYYMFRTTAGRNLRSIGENPAAADAAGIDVTGYKYFHLLLGGAISGIGGAYASMIVSNGVWIDNNICEFGWIAVALVIFATWNPMKAILGSFLFGALKVIRYYLPSSIISIPNGFYDMLPFLITAIILVVTSIRNAREKSQPEGCGINYFREER